MKKNVLFLSAFLMLLGAHTLAAAVDQGDLEFQDGVVDEISPDQIILMKEYADVGLEDLFIFEITPDVQLEKFQSLNELKVDDEVVVGFVSEEGKDIAKTILRVNKAPLNEQELSPESGALPPLPEENTPEEALSELADQAVDDVAVNLESGRKPVHE